MTDINEHEDRALGTLRAVGSELHPDISLDLIDAIYRIESRTQFDEDRDEAIRNVERVIEAYLDQMGEGA